MTIQAVSKQKRMTKQRRLIYEILASTKSHPTAEWIYNEARKTMPAISLGTVYRNLQVLAAENQIIELNYGKGQSRFDAHTAPHYHFVCERCGAVMDCPHMQPLFEMEQISDAPGEVHDYRLEFYGVCKDCLRTQRDSH